MFNRKAAGPPASSPATGSRPSPTPKLAALLEAEPDLVDRIFDYVLELFPAMRDKDLSAARDEVRREFAGGSAYIPGRARGQRAGQVLSLFNGRNATEVARKLGISRASVYRYLKQPGQKKGEAVVSVFHGNETAMPVASGRTPDTTAAKAQR